MALCPSLSAQENNSTSIPKVSQDQRLTPLISRYTRYPYKAPKITTELDLPAPLQPMVKNAKTELLDELQNTCRTLLFQHAAILDLPIDWFGDYPTNPPAEQLQKILDTTWEYLKISHGIIADLNSFLDWYAGDDWHAQFGATGLYQRLRQCDQDTQFLLAVYAYYHARVPQPNSENNIPLHVKKSFELIKRRMNDSKQNSQSLRALQLWYFRLGRVLAKNEPALYQETRQELENILKSPLEPEQQYNFHLESLRYALAAPTMRLSDLESLNLKTRLFRDWLRGNQYTVVHHKNKSLELAVLESLLLQKQRSLTISVPPVREQSYLSDRSYLKPMIDLAQREPRWSSWVQEMIAARLAASISNLEKKQRKDWEKYIRNATGFELLSLARYYRNQTPPDFAKTQNVYEIFIQTHSPTHDKMPEVLYDAAVCCYQLAQPDPNGHSKLENRDYQVQAIHYWNRLAHKFPRWTGSSGTRNVSAFQGLIQSADRAYRLATESPDLYSPLARQTLSILVGGISSDGSEPVGPFATTPAAGVYRYYYALLLFSDNQYDQAANWFDAVPRNDPHCQAARCFAIRCRYQLAQTEAKKQNQPISTRRHPSWIKTLETLLQEEYSDSLAEQAVPLLIRLYQELNQTNDALSVLTQALRRNPHQPQWIGFALKIFQEQRSNLLQLHAGANYLELSNKLKTTLPASQTVYEIFESGSGKKRPLWEQQRLLATRNYIEQLCMAAITTSDHKESPSVPPLRSLIDRADKAIATTGKDPAYANQVWFVRCQAILAFVKGQFEPSRQHWHQIRSAVAEKKDEQETYFWWESRYFSLRCLIQLNRSEEAKHALDVLLRSHPNETSPWFARLKALRSNNESSRKRVE